MDLGNLLGGFDTDQVKDVVELVVRNRDVLERLGDLPELFERFGEGLDGAADQARAAGVALVGDDGEGGVRGTLDVAAAALKQIAGSLGKGASLLGDAADGVGKVPLMDTPAKRFASAAKELDSSTGTLGDLSEAMSTIAATLEDVGRALNGLGDSLADSGGQARGFLSS